MISCVVITKNIKFIKKLLKEMDEIKLNVNMKGVITTKEEIIEAVRGAKYDIIFLDRGTSKEYNREFFKVSVNSIIPLIYREGFNILDYKNVKSIKALIEKKDLENKKEQIIKELEYIGYKFKYKGTHYLAETIMEIYRNKAKNRMVENLQSDIYPVIAEKYHKTIYNVKSSISKATECMYYECDIKKLEKYFRLCDDMKPTVKQVVFAVINKI